MVTPPWGLTVASGDPVVLVGMLAGSGWLWVEHGDAVLLDQGAIAIVLGAQRVEVADDPATRSDLVILGPDDCFDPLSGRSRRDEERRAQRWWGDPDAPGSVLVAGYEAAGERFAALASDLPRVMVTSADPTVGRFLEAAGHEAVADEPGQQVVFDRLMELLLCGSIRSWLAVADHPPSWCRAVGDPSIGLAIRAIHGDPARPWTVDDLASVAARSRSGFARRFREVVGEPPMRYVARWRLAWAADLLADGLAVTAVAHTVGYTDAYAFSTAFRRHHGVTPREHRNRTRTALPTSHGLY